MSQFSEMGSAEGWTVKNNSKQKFNSRADFVPFMFRPILLCWDKRMGLNINRKARGRYDHCTLYSAGMLILNCIRLNFSDWSNVRIAGLKADCGKVLPLTQASEEGLLVKWDFQIRTPPMHTATVATCCTRSNEMHVLCSIKM